MANDVMDRSIEYGKEMGCNYLCGICVTYSSLRVYQRYNMHPVAELPYDRFRYKGELIFDKNTLVDKCPGTYFSIGKI